MEESFGLIKEKSHDSHFVLYLNSNFKWITSLNVKPKTTKLLIKVE